MRTNVDVHDCLGFAIKLALEAGEMIRAGQAKRFASQATTESTKSNSVDLVTEVDKAVEAFIYRRIKETFPDHAFIGEETYAGQSIPDAPTWIVDPIDGTTNFIHGYPMVATSIGLAVGGIPIVGVVYNPFLDLLYSAAKGQGAYLNGTARLPITGKPRPLATLHDALIHVDIGASRTTNVLHSRLKTFGRLAGSPDQGGKMVHSLRSIGCASLNLCLVASGGQDMHWEIGCWPWDVCAGLCILAEAGGAAFGGKNTSLCGTVNAELLAGRKYLFVRAVAPEKGETGFAVQRRLAHEFYDTTDDIEP
ncbi:Inositol monophosphatase 2 [Saitozyma sp. JCM 24511]|nr:Inositol monophosphatase 2 [Saitozyma sp. JCM 24511]